MMLLLMITGMKTRNLLYVVPIIPVLVIFDIFLRFMTDWLCLFAKPLLLRFQTRHEHTSIDSWGKLIDAVKNGMSVSTSYSKVGYVLYAIISVSYGAKQRITRNYRNKFKSIKCIFNEWGRLSAFATAMTLKMDLNSRTGQARNETQIKACWSLAEIYIPVVLLEEGLSA